MTEVALLLEAAIQKGELGKGGYEAWILLGEVRSMDEREEAGMKALAEGVKRAEAAGAAGEGMLVTIFSSAQEKRYSHHLTSPWQFHTRMSRMRGVHTPCSFVGLPRVIPPSIFQRKLGNR